MLSITNIAKRREKKSPFRHTGILAVPSVTISDKHQQQLEKHPTTTRQDNQYTTTTTHNQYTTTKMYYD